MSDFFAVGGVSAVLKWILSNDLSAAGLHTALGSAAGVSVLAPDRVPTGGTEQPQLNLFMYYASLNGSYRNTDLPSRDDQGRRLTNPPLPLNLHYLVSAYGKNEFDSEILLAWAMQWFHENPVIARKTIQDSLAAMAAAVGATSEVQAIAATTLASQFELLKITPEALSNEEISKLWMAFSTHYRPTASYQISVVLLQETQPVKSNLPVQFRNVKALPWQSPTIDTLLPNIIGAGELLTITGRNFIGDAVSDTLVAFDENKGIVPDTIGPTVIRITVPSSLRAGVHTVRVVRNVQFGANDPHPGFSSSPAPFLLAPTITDATPVPANVAANLTVHVSPPVERTQRATLLIGDYGIEIDARPPNDPPTSISLVFPLPADTPHTNPATAVPLRVQIDTAQSRLTLDTNPVSPTFGQFFPQIKVTGP